MNRIYCPHCHSEDVDNRLLTEPAPPLTRVSIDELGGNGWRAPQYTPAVYRVTHYRPTCRACGYSRDYEPSGVVYA